MRIAATTLTVCGARLGVVVGVDHGRVEGGSGAAHSVGGIELVLGVFQPHLQLVVTLEELLVGHPLLVALVLQTQLRYGHYQVFM